MRLLSIKTIHEIKEKAAEAKLQERPIRLLYHPENFLARVSLLSMQQRRHAIWVICSFRRQVLSWPTESI